MDSGSIKYQLLWLYGEIYAKIDISYARKNMIIIQYQELKA